MGEDLSATDTYALDSPTVRAARQAAAVSHRNYIAYRAALLSGENQRIAAQLNAGAAQMAGMAPAHWRQPVTEYAQPAPVNTAASLPAETTTNNRKGTIQAVDRTWKQDPASPTPPVDPKAMTAAQARAAWDTVNEDIARWDARCGRTFILPNEQAAYDSCIADKGPLLERQAAIRARLKDLGIPIEGEQSAGSAREEPPFPPPEHINGFTSHGRESADSHDGHGVSDSAMQDAVEHPVTPPRFKVDEQGRGAYAYEGKDAVVVLNKDGQVVTAWSKNHFGWRHP